MATITVDASYQGNYYVESTDYPPSWITYGRTTGNYSCGYLNSEPVRRNYMVFAIPTLGTINSIILKMNTGQTASTGGVNITYRLYEITSGNITNIINNTNTQTVFEDLGKGAVMSPSASPTQSFTFSAYASNHNTDSGTPTFTLNSTFITDITAAMGSNFGIGGAFGSPIADGFDGSGDDNCVFWSYGASGTAQLIIDYSAGYTPPTYWQLKPNPNTGNTHLLF